jgi:hypothetical protein
MGNQLISAVIRCLRVRSLGLYSRLSPLYALIPANAAVEFYVAFDNMSGINLTTMCPLVPKCLSS